MGKKVIIWVCIVLPIALLGLTFMQVRWIMEAYTLRDSRFDQTVNKCVDRVVTRLETDEIIESKHDKMMSLRDFVPFTKSRNEGGKTTSSEEIAVSFKLDNFGFYKLDAVRDGKLLSTDAGIVTLRSTFGDDIVSNSYFVLNDILNKKMRYQQVEKTKSIFEDRPIEVRVNPQRLDALLMQEFTDNGISLPYEFAVYNSAGQMSFSSPAFDANKANDEDGRIYEKKLYPNDIHARAHFVKVYFFEQPDTLSTLSGLIVPTAFFLLLVLTLSTMTVVIIFRQKELDAIKNDFIGNMTHEFKTPISTMSLSAQMLKDLADVAKPDLIRRNTDIIIDEGKRLTIQVEKILQMASFDRGKARLKFVERDVNQIVDKVVKTFRVKVETFNGEINERLDATNAKAMVDDVHFTNVIYNLLDNAIKYRRDAPMLHVWTRNANNGIIISVKDNGLGISKEDQKRIFEKFYRVSTGDRHDVKGFGLGLAYVKKIVEDHDGQISVESELNVGSKFDIYLPIKK